MQDLRNDAWLRFLAETDFKAPIAQSPFQKLVRSTVKAVCFILTAKYQGAIK